MMKLSRYIIGLVVAFTLGIVTSQCAVAFIERPDERFHVVITGHVNGDKFYASRVGTPELFRLRGVNAPERGHKGWEQPTERLADLLPIGTTVELQVFGKARYANQPSVVVYSRQAEPVADTLIREGLATRGDY